MVVALVALVMGSAGGATAATFITGKQIRNSSITGADIRNSSIRGADVRDRSLTPRDFRGSLTGPAGPAGPAGAAGPTGQQGEQGPVGPSTGAAGGDLAGNYPNPTIGASAVGGAEIQDRSLNLADVAVDHSNTSANLATINPNACTTLDTPFADNAVVGDLTIIVPRDTVDARLTVEGMRVTVDGTFKWRTCNRTDVAFDPVQFNFDWIVVRP